MAFYITEDTHYELTDIIPGEYIVNSGVRFTLGDNISFSSTINDDGTTTFKITEPVDQNENIMF